MTLPLLGRPHVTLAVGARKPGHRGSPCNMNTIIVSRAGHVNGIAGEKAAPAICRAIRHAEHSGLTIDDRGGEPFSGSGWQFSGEKTAISGLITGIYASRRDAFSRGMAGDFACDPSSCSPSGQSELKRDGDGTDKPQECTLYDLLFTISFAERACC